MARCGIQAGDDFILKLEKLSSSIDAVAIEAVYEGAKIMADEINKNLKNVLSGESTGDLEESFGITPISKDGGEWSAKIGFSGYDEKGTANQLKARVIESGTSDGTHEKRPFVRPAINSKKKQVVQKMNEVIEKGIKKATD